MYLLFGKRVFDLYFAIVALALLMPLMLLIALMIKFFDPGPLIFKQMRIGRHGVPFELYKFRSMPVNTSDVPSDQLGHVSIGPIGQFVRRTNIDELPQLLNILKGDMSIVGPRPSIPSQTELIALRTLNGALDCLPGLTGLAQIRSFNGMTASQKGEFDGHYAREVTFMKDVKLIIGTFIYLLKPPPTY